MSTVTQTMLSEQEFLRLHGHETGVDLVAGQIVRYPMPGGPHGYIVSNAVVLVHAFVKSHDLGRVFTCDTFVRTKTDPVTLRGADVAYLSYHRFPRGPIPDGPLPVAPELVLEVRSPTDRIAAVSAKAQEYIEAGVLVVVYLDPRTMSVAVYEGDDFPQRLHYGDELTFPDILPGFAVPTRQFFE